MFVLISHEHDSSHAVGNSYYSSSVLFLECATSSLTLDMSDCPALGAATRIATRGGDHGAKASTHISL
jgi:hypothetical protein